MSAKIKLPLIYKKISALVLTIAVMVYNFILFFKYFPLNKNDYIWVMVVIVVLSIFFGYLFGRSEKDKSGLFLFVVVIIIAMSVLNVFTNLIGNQSCDARDVYQICLFFLLPPILIIFSLGLIISGRKQKEVQSQTTGT